MFLKIRFTFLCLLLLFSHKIINSQSISFSSSGLVGTNINNPTSLDFGPNGKLYVSQQNGTIWEYDVERDSASAGNGTYSITNTNQITLIKNNTPNHNDDGTNNSTQARQITGILTAGTASNPILYITSSDSRIGGGGSAGNDVNLDTNSGVLSRLSWNGNAWEKVDLVRGLPRCEENHSTNGLDLFTSGGNTYLLIQVGGNTNEGAPSNNFAGSTEFYLSGALLIVNLTQLEQMESNNGGPYLDPRTANTAYIYDLPSLNDPERQDIDNTHPSFPYDSSHPMYNATIDLGDPFGGNNGLNQTFSENGGPVQIFSPGYRNAYDVVITEDGRIFTYDNGPNAGWGGAPLIYDNNDTLKGTQNSTTYNSGSGDYVTNQFNIENGTTQGDALHYVGTINDANNTYYGGHPVPIRAFPDKAGVYKYQYNGSSWVENGAYDWSSLISGVTGYFNPTGFTMVDFPNDPRQGNYDRSLNSVDVNILDIVNSSTNGICEYTATNFDGAMQGDILSASFNGNINRYVFNTDGTTLLSKDNGFLNGFGSIPLDLIALGDSHTYAGTIWVVTYGANDVTVFEPVDFGECPQPNDINYVGSEDYDNDGYINDDEISNGTNHCSAGSQPDDNDADFISDLTDPDDDNDGILDVNDAFPIDAQNGLGTNLPLNYPFWNNDPGTGFFGLGFTGLQLNPSGATDYLNQFNSDNLSFGGAGGKATVDEVSSGTSLNETNNQENAFQFGVNLDTNSNPFTVYSKIETPFNGSAPLAGQSYGIYIGNGDQDNYLQVAIMDGTVSGDSTYGFKVVLEENGVSTSATYDVANLLQATGVNLYISVNPSTNSAQVYYSLNNGITISSLGSTITLPASFLDPNDGVGVAVGIISTSGSSESEYIATWDFINVVEDSVNSLEPLPNMLDFGQSNTGGSINELNLSLKNLGNPNNGAIEITQLNFVGTNADLFNSNLSLPIQIGPQADALIPIAFTPDNNGGTKTATLEITHNGSNSPLSVSLTSEITIEVPVVRISAGSPTIINSTDAGPDWESNPSEGAYNSGSYSVNTGKIFASSFQYSNRDNSIPDYIDEVTFNGLFNSERYDSSSAPEMEFSIPVTNGNYTVNLYLGNSFEGTNQTGNRIYDIFIEGNLVQDNLDLITRFGHQVAGMLSYPASVDDGILNISFGHEVENPLINAIEVIQVSLTGNQPPNAVASASVLTGETPLNVDFTGTASTDDNNSIVSYNWDFGNGDSSNIADPNYTFNQPGSYQVTLTVTDEEGNTDTESLNINVTSPDICQWNPLADSDLEKIEAQSAKIGDKLYVFAGFLGGLQITGATEIYDTISNTWSYGAPMPEPLTHAGIAKVGTDIWIIGGFIGSNPGVATDKVQIYNTVSDSWSYGPDLPAARASGASAFNNGKVHFFGGLMPDRQTDVGEHYIFDTNNPGLGWIAAAQLPDPRNHLGGASFNSLVYAIGGQFGHDVSVDDQKFLDVYNPATDSWTRLADLPAKRSHFEPGTIVHNGKIIIVGGRNGESFFYNTITEYDPITDIWSELCELPENLLAPGAKVFGDRLIVVNGGLDGISEPVSSTRWISIEDQFPILEIDPISDQSNEVGESINLTISASGGDPDGNVTYTISGQPLGLSIEPTNGQIIGTVDVSALNGGPNNDGTHFVNVIATKPYSEDTNLQFTWTVIGNVWSDKDENENYTARHECSFVQAGDKFFMFGGRESARTLDIYDYANNSWNSLVNSAPFEFNHFQAIEYQGLIWVIGAFKTNNYPNETPADFIWSFNPATQEWIQGPEIPSGRKRGSTGLAVYNDKFYILAGNTNGHSGGYVNWFDEYDPNTGIWSQLADAPRPRDHFHIAVINSKLYAASGRLSGGDGGVFGPVLSEVDVYDFTTQTWSTLPPSQNIPTPRAAGIVANFENRLIISGGEVPGNSEALNITEIYDPLTESWINGDPLNHKRHGTQGIVSGNGIFIAGGSPNQGGGNQKNMEFYGQDNPVGSPSINSELTSTENVIFGIGESKIITLSNINGNIGNILKDVVLSGSDASEFSIYSGNIPFKLIKYNSSHDIIINYTGNSYGKSAVLTITYNNSETLVINLTVPTYDIIYDGSSWSPYAPDDSTSTENALILSGQYTVSSDIELNFINIENNASLIIEAGYSVISHDNIHINGNGYIELRSTESMFSSLIPHGSIDGNIIYKRHVNSNSSSQGGIGSNDLISAPLTGQTFSEFIIDNPNIFSNTDNSLYLFGPFNKSTGSYQIFSNTESATLDPGLGYRAASSDTGTFLFNGIVNLASVNVPIYNSGPAYEEWNLIGNPYPSYISLSEFLSTNTGQLNNSGAAVYGYDGDASDGWTIWNQAFSDSNPGTLIAPGQGFFVSANVGGGQISFNPSMRAIGNSNDFIVGRNNSSSTFNHLKLKIEQNENSYYTDFYFNPNANRGLDKGYDAELWGGIVPNFAIYSFLVNSNSGLPFAIQSLNEFDYSDVVIPIGVNASLGEEMIISLDENTLPENISIYMEDHLTQSSILLNDSDFILTPSDDLSAYGRLYLRFFDNSLSSEYPSFDSLNIFTDYINNTINISGKLEHRSIAKLYDLQGRLVQTHNLELGLLNQKINVNGLTGGIYLLIIENSYAHKTKKVLLK